MVLLNILYDLTCLSIPWDRVDAQSIARPVRWDTRSIARFMCCFGPVSPLFDMVTFAVMITVIGPMAAGGDFASLGGHDAALFVAVFQSGWFIVSMWTQITALHLLRTEQVPFAGSHARAPLAVTSLAALVIVTTLPFTQLGAWFGFHALPVWFAALLAGVVVCYAALALTVKKVYLKRVHPLL